MSQCEYNDAIHATKSRAGVHARRAVSCHKIFLNIMLVIRLSRVGRHNHAQYHVVVQEKTKAPTGKHIAVVGSYDPHSKHTVLKEDLIKKFLADGAQPSDTVHNLLVKNGLIDGAKRAVKVPPKKEEAPADNTQEKAADAASTADGTDNAKAETTVDAKDDAKVDATTKEKK